MKTADVTYIHSADIIETLQHRIDQAGIKPELLIVVVHNPTSCDDEFLRVVLEDAFHLENSFIDTVIASCKNNPQTSCTVCEADYEYELEIATKIICGVVNLAFAKLGFGARFDLAMGYNKVELDAAKMFGK